MSHYTRHIKYFFHLLSLTFTFTYLLVEALRSDERIVATLIIPDDGAIQRH